LVVVEHPRHRLRAHSGERGDISHRGHGRTKTLSTRWLTSVHVGFAGSVSIPRGTGRPSVGASLATVDDTGDVFGLDIGDIAASTVPTRSPPFADPPAGQTTATSQDRLRAPSARGYDAGDGTTASRRSDRRAPGPPDRRATTNVRAPARRTHHDIRESRR